MALRQQKPLDARTRLEMNAKQSTLPTRNPFESPSLSTSSLNETDDDSTSGQSEFHLERHSGNTKYQHLRQISKASTTASTTASDREKKPDLSIVTDFSAPVMPMNTEGVTVNKVPAKQARAGRNWALSIVSQKGVQLTATPVDQERQDLQVPRQSWRKRQASTKRSKKIKHVQRLQHAIKRHAQSSPRTQWVPTGVTLPADTALPPVTPRTPAIVVTPAGQQKPWVLQKTGDNELSRPASSIYSAMPTSRIPPIPRFVGKSISPKETRNLDHQASVGVRERRISEDSSEAVLPDSSDSARPKSQGWWNLMLSPLLRNASLASRKGPQAAATPPVPPLPFSASEKYESPALSARSDPSCLVSENDTSPETPRRAGLASARASTWSRWTEWEEQREANGQKEVETDDEAGRQREVDEPQLIPAPPPARPGLAAEYFHACAVEQLTGEPYFECINHSCAEKLPRLHSVYDAATTKAVVLGSPFGESRESKAHAEPGTCDAANLLKSPSIDADVHSPLSPNELSPNVRQASIAPFVKARSLGSLSGDKAAMTAKSSHESRLGQSQDREALSAAALTVTVVESAPTTYTAPRNNDELPSIASVTRSEKVPVSDSITDTTAPPRLSVEPVSEKAQQSPASPGPISPEGQKSLAPMNDVQMSEFGQKNMPYGPAVTFNNYATPNPLPGRPTFITSETSYPDLPQRAPMAAITAADISTPRRFNPDIEAHRQRLEKEDAIAKKAGSLWRGRGCFSSTGCMARGGSESRARRRWIIIISIVLLAIIIVCIILAVTLTRRGDVTPVNSIWLNLTGYPPMPTGILTIASPNLVYQQKQCMFTTTMWTCSVPKEDRNQLYGNDADQPNFRFEIKFRNGTVPANMTLPLSSNSTMRKQKTANDPFTNDLYVPNPLPPNIADQIFMGNTTDNITAPFNGEQTPFYVTFMPTYPVVPSSFNTSSTSKSTLNHRRQSSNSSLSSFDPSTIPAPLLVPDGSAAPANLLPTNPYAINQPVRLYNRGLKDEHYGFYIYYDKSIYLSGFPITPNSWNGSQNDPRDADQDGGSVKAQAVSRCTFAQTRFLVKFFTQPAFGGSLLATPLPLGSGFDDSSKKNQTSSAMDFSKPGSFPYPASIVVDRHGGDIDEKGVYCYGMSNGQIIKDQKLKLPELLNFGGALVNNPNLDSDTFNKTAGGIDGGTGGCGCEWQNWQ